MPKIASKTFLIGEYAIFNHAPALIWPTPPYFTYTFEGQSTFHPESPAGRLQKIYPTTPISFTPHGLKGLGQSSAEFLSMYLAAHPEITLPMQTEEAHQAWLNYQTHQPMTASGADLIAQCLDGPHFIQVDPWQAEPAPWPFPNLTWCLVHTGQKLATHQHLQENISIPKALSTLAHQSKEAYETEDEKRFLDCVKSYQATLEAHDLSAPYTIALIHALKNDESVLAAKGCGAMGSEVLWVISTPTAMEKAKTTLSQLAINVFYDQPLITT
jgi:mevalonate kinase